jgi:diguanylate cyclase (GGDEF)-like protein
VGILVIAVGNATHNDGLTEAAVGVVTLCPAAVWAGVQVFVGKRVSPLLLFAGTAFWLVLMALPLGADLHAAAGFVPPIAYLAAASHTLWREKGEHLATRWALIGFFMLHATMFVGGIVDALAGRFNQPALPTFETWFGLINIESLIYSMGTALFMVVMVKERSERRLVQASRTDPLTGVANRGALLEGGSRLLRRCQQEGMSFSLAIFDVDHFKRVNDTYGHAMGDEVLRTFAETTLSILRPGDLFGRYGGEEFVMILPRATIEAAYVIAERIRTAFASKSVAHQGVRCTTSAGVASAGSALTSLEDIIKVADGCLYRAKELGRNRVERPETAEEPEESVVRIA